MRVTAPTIIATVALLILSAVSNVHACDLFPVAWRSSERSAIRHAPVAFYGTIIDIQKMANEDTLLTIAVARGTRRGIKGRYVKIVYSLDGGSAACNFDQPLVIAIGDRFAFLGARNPPPFTMSIAREPVLVPDLSLLNFDYFYHFPKSCYYGLSACQQLARKRRTLVRQLRAL